MVTPTNLEGSNPVVQGLFQPAKATNPYIKKGDLIVFHYSLYKHDPRPHIVVTDVNPGGRMRGVNIHYLPFVEIKRLLGIACNNTGFSYRNFATPRMTGTKKVSTPLEDAFRSYKWSGIKRVQKLDCDFVMSVMNMVRSFDPAEIEIVRNLVREQIQRQVNQKATEIAHMQRITPIAPQVAQQTVPPIAPVAPTIPTSTGNASTING